MISHFGPGMVLPVAKWLSLVVAHRAMAPVGPWLSKVAGGLRQDLVAVFPSKVERVPPARVDR